MKRYHVFIKSFGIVVIGYIHHQPKKLLCSQLHCFQIHVLFELFQFYFFIMATDVTAPSLQRTNSNGNLNVYLIIKNKTNDDPLNLSREHLSPALRTGRLISNQKITFRDEERHTREGTIIYMRKCSTVLSYIYFNIFVLTIDHDRDNFIIKKKNC